MRFRCAWLLCATLATGRANAGPADREDRPPANLVAGEAARGIRLDPVFALLTVDRMSCRFSETKHIALLAKPLRSSGMIYFDRKKGVVRKTLVPKPADVVVTPTALRMQQGTRSETIPLGQIKELRAFALIVPTLLRGDRAELERSFDIGLYGSERSWWALAFAPRSHSLSALVQRVVVLGHRGNVVSLQVTEASGDRTDTELSELVINGDVSASAIATAFGDM